jgi:hypothetical protein
VNDETSSEDLTILATLAALERGDAPGGGAHPAAAPAPGDTADTREEMLARLYNEVLGLLPYELAPVAPAPAVKARLMATVVGDETQPSAAALAAATAVPSQAALPLQPVPPRRPALPTPLAPQRPPAMGRPSGVSPAPSRPATQEEPFWRPSVARAASAPRRPNRWPLGLAASLAFLLLGLSGWLFFEMNQAHETIARLNQDLEARRSLPGGAPRSPGDALDMREKLALVTSPRVELSALRPDGPAPSQPYARGMLFVAADHQHWYLSVQGLRPVGSGKAYKLWFVADRGMVDAGSFIIDPKNPIELSSKEMPAGTKAAVITLEDDPRAPAPAGPTVLRGGPMTPLT